MFASVILNKIFKFFLNFLSKHLNISRVIILKTLTFVNMLLAIYLIVKILLYFS